MEPPRRLLEPLTGVNNSGDIGDVSLAVSSFPLSLEELQALKPKHGQKSAKTTGLKSSKSTVSLPLAALVLPKKRDLLSRVASTDTFARVSAALSAGGEENLEVRQAEAKLLKGLGLSASPASTPLLPPPLRTTTPQTSVSVTGNAAKGKATTAVVSGLSALLSAPPDDDEDLRAVLRMVGLSQQPPFDAPPRPPRQTHVAVEVTEAETAEANVETSRSTGDEASSLLSKPPSSPFLVPAWGLGLQRQREEEEAKRKEEQAKRDKDKRKTDGGFRASSASSTAAAAAGHHRTSSQAGAQRLVPPTPMSIKKAGQLASLAAVATAPPPSAGLSGEADITAPLPRSLDHITQWIPAELVISQLIPVMSSQDQGPFTEELFVATTAEGATTASALLQSPGVAAKNLEAFKRRHPKVFGAEGGDATETAVEPVRRKSAGRATQPSPALLAFSSPFGAFSEAHLMEKAGTASAGEGNRPKVRRLFLSGGAGGERPVNHLLEPQPDSLLVDGSYSRQIAADRGMGLLLSFETAAECLREGGRLEGLSPATPLFVLATEESGEERLNQYLEWRGTRTAAMTSSK